MKRTNLFLFAVLCAVTIHAQQQGIVRYVREGGTGKGTRGKTPWAFGSRTFILPPARLASAQDNSSPENTPTISTSTALHSSTAPPPTPSIWAPTHA